MRGRPGFTIIELMVVVAVIAVIAAISLPNLVSARVTANETSALATLRTLTAAQSQLQAGGYVDVDGDGNGEYGFFRELSGGVGVRTTDDGSTVGSLLAPPIMSATFRRVSAFGTINRSGYEFRIALPAADGKGVYETSSGAFSGVVDADLAETTWGATAWPANTNMTGNRSFFVNQSGDILSTEAPEYTGENPTFPAGSAFQVPGNVESMTGQPAIGTFGRDGNLWRQCN